jgi:alginate O-acetyltransferase complex protein AlgI
MIFNSVEFAIFFPVVFLIYWLLLRKNIAMRNLFIIAVSYFFYGVWDWRFLFLILLSSAGDYILGALIHKAESQKTRKMLIITSLVVNLGILGFFKYFNFFVESFVSTFSLFGKEFSYESLNIILPVGISFYTFQTLSYTIDIYYRKFEPAKNPLAFFAFVSFFPQLVAGPIERAKDLLPQFYDQKNPDYDKIKSGILMVAVGLFKKIVIADRLAIYVDTVYGDIGASSGLPMLFGVLFFAFQLYIDFSAYSDIAIGLSRMMGFELSINFKRPYLSTSFANFWSRWHISLSSWFRDYVYIPLGGNRNGKGKTIRNIMIVFLLSGLWHGASWNFVIWGGLNGLFLILLDRILVKDGRSPFPNYVMVFTCWMLSLIFFRSETFADSMLVFSNIGFSNAASLYEFGLTGFEFKLVIWLLVGLMILEYMAEKNVDVVTWIASKSVFVRYTFYFGLVFFILIFGAYGGVNDSNFIYFQF